jgi:phage shock protein E
MIYIDVRTPEEFESGHYPDAINHPVELIMQGMFPELAKDTEIYLYCRSGARSGIAQQMMQQSGFVNVINKGGLSDLK